MIRKYIFLFLTVLAVCSSCGLNIVNENTFTATPGFVTSTLPPTKIPPPTHTPFPATPTTEVIEETMTSSIDGTTTTQLNVRAEPSTASEPLGMVNQFATIQVIGKDASGSWYQIIFADSAAGKGWVRAEYVQVDAAAEMPIIGGMTGLGSGVSGLVVQKVNVRNGPGLNYESLGVLNPKDVVFIIGKDPSGEWMQIEFASATEGKGWAALKYLQVENSDSIPVIDAAIETTETPASITSTAIQDGDSMEMPIAAAVFSATGTQALQVISDVSAPDGDMEDWIQFTAYRKYILVEAICSSSALHVELWSGGKYVSDVAFACGEKLKMETVTKQPYYFRIQAISEGGPQYLRYILKISTLE